MMSGNMVLSDELLIGIILKDCLVPCCQEKP
ncbi:MAG: hypothetical protein ACI8WB_005421 [Phenylobacterium sp.]|jgi:hypothetical protein